MPTGRANGTAKRRKAEEWPVRVRMKVEVRGIVQGVGFRPFIHRLVSGYGFLGWVRNSSRGVDMELEGEESELREFASRIAPEAPLLADVESVECAVMDTLANFAAFEIVESRTMASMDTLISPDIGICPDCLREMRTPGDKRYRYPFLNCTNCGPRFTIIRDVPYDRARTSMGVFPMCPDCEREYRDITDRRYHAEPTCCPDCGPQVFYDGPGEERLEGEAALEKARQTLKEGKILCVKGLGGMHLCCLPEKATLLRQRKQRDGKPFALMCRDADCARELCGMTAQEEELLTSQRRPIVLLPKKRRDEWMEVSENGYMGVMLPYTPLHYLLFGDDIDALIMTSANLSDKPIMYRNDEAERELRGIADGFLLHDRDILTRCDDSLLCVADGREYPLRRSRGYVPYPIRIGELTESILACGAEQKASFVLSKPGMAFPSQHIGDLKNFETYENYRQQIGHFERLFDITPRRIACDLHPDYLSTRCAEEMAEELGVPLIRVQHHHAHMAACMADNSLTGEVIGLIWDGTGYGTDGTVWGGEFLTGGYGGFTRRGHLRPLPLIGGDRAVKEIWRLGLAMTGREELYGGYDASAALRQLHAGLNCPLSSGMGRLFDAAASVMGLCQTASYEGQGAVLLEAAAEADCRGRYAVKIDEGCVFDYEPMAGELLRDREAGVDAGVMAARFMNTLMDMAVAVTERIGGESGLEDVVLSGGSFQNMYIMARLPGMLREKGFRVWTHSRVSCNDEGLSLGQLMIALHAGC